MRKKIGNWILILNWISSDFVILCHIFGKVFGKIWCLEKKIIVHNDEESVGNNLSKKNYPQQNPKFLQDISEDISVCWSFKHCGWFFFVEQELILLWLSKKK